MYPNYMRIGCRKKPWHRKSTDLRKDCTHCMCNKADRISKNSSHSTNFKQEMKWQKLIICDSDSKFNLTA